MMSRSRYYEENLYPIQDGIMSALSALKTPFYLTGGTALSRIYYGHRYSDDLDFFVNNDPQFSGYVNEFLLELKNRGYYYDESSLIFSSRFVSVYIRQNEQTNENDSELKLDFVNDIEAHYGGYTASEIFPKIDSIRNILSNKIGAVFRLSGKDIADIREIALHEVFSWDEILIEARNKDAGVEANIIAEIISSTPKKAFDDIVWTNQPTWDDFKKDINQVAEDMLLLGKNTLWRGGL